VEAYLYLTPRLAVLLGTGYIRAWRGPEASRMTVERNPSPIISDLSLDMKIRAVPVYLGLRYDIPLAGNMGIFLKGCAGYYFAGYSRLSREDLSGVEPGGYDWYTYQEDGRSGGFGFQAGAGFEYRLNRVLGFVIECSGRLAKISGFNVDYSDEYSYGPSGSGSGTLYYYEYRDQVSGNWYPTTTVAENPLPEDAMTRNVREAAFDLSGFAVKAGVKISF